MLVAAVNILFWWFLLILDEFWYEINCIRKIISLLFYAYVKHQKWSTDAILVSVLVWMWTCHSSHRQDKVIISMATVSILFWWFSLIPNEFWYKTSCIGNVIFLPFYIYVERKKRSTDVILASVLVWKWLCHSSHRHDNISNAHGSDPSFAHAGLGLLWRHSFGWNFRNIFVKDENFKNTPLFMFILKLLPPFLNICWFDFFTSTLITHLIKKIKVIKNQI
jgi:hypothetical protein